MDAAYRYISFSCHRRTRMMRCFSFIMLHTNVDGQRDELATVIGRLLTTLRPLTAFATFSVLGGKVLDSSTIIIGDTQVPLSYSVEWLREESVQKRSWVHSAISLQTSYRQTGTQTQS